MGSILLLPSRKQLHQEQAARDRDLFLHPRGASVSAVPQKSMRATTISWNTALSASHNAAPAPHLLCRLCSFATRAGSCTYTDKQPAIQAVFFMGKKTGLVAGCILKTGFPWLSQQDLGTSALSTQTATVFPEIQVTKYLHCRTRRGIHLVNLTPHTGISQHTQPLLCRCYISETQLWLPATIYMQSGPSSYICPCYTAAEIAAPVLTREKLDPLDLTVPC